jgi:cell wall-associated NlpC family hydrolase
VEWDQGIGVQRGQFSELTMTASLSEPARAALATPKAHPGISAPVVAFLERPEQADRLVAELWPGREVYRLDLRKPDVGFNPLLSSDDPAELAARVARVLCGLPTKIEIEQTEQLQIEQAIRATGAKSPEESSDPPTFRRIQNLLVAEPATRRAGERLGPLTTEPVDRVLRHPAQISIGDVVQSNRIVVVTGGADPEQRSHYGVIAGLLVGEVTAALSRSRATPARRSQLTPSGVTVYVGDALQAQPLMEFERLQLAHVNVVAAPSSSAELHRVAQRPSAQAPLKRRTPSRGSEERTATETRHTISAGETFRLRAPAHVSRVTTEEETPSLPSGSAEQWLREALGRRNEHQRRALMLGSPDLRRGRKRERTSRSARVSFTQAACSFIGLAIAIVLMAVVALVAGAAVIRKQADENQNQPSLPGIPGIPDIPDVPIIQELPVIKQLPEWARGLSKAGVGIAAAKITPDPSLNSGPIPAWSVAVFNEAASALGVNAYLLASIADQESSFGSPDSKTINSSGCAGFMQIGFEGACGDSWDSQVALTSTPAATFADRTAYMFGARPASAGPQPAVPAGTQNLAGAIAASNDPFTAVMAAAALLRNKMGGQTITSLDGTAYRALCGYYGACADSVADYAPTVLARAQDWQAHGYLGTRSVAPAGTQTNLASAVTTSVPGDLPSRLAQVSASDLAGLSVGELLTGFGELRSWVGGGPAPVSNTVLTAATSPAASTPAAAAALAFAFAQVGSPYVWGGNGPASCPAGWTGARGCFDCSGLTQAAYRTAGIELPRVAQDQYDAGPHVPAGAPLEPGDLVFFGGGPQDVTHVGMVVRPPPPGGPPVARMVDAPHTGAFVRTEPFPTTVGAAWGGDIYVGATRPSAAKLKAAGSVA